MHNKLYITTNRLPSLCLLPFCQPAQPRVLLTCLAHFWHFLLFSGHHFCHFCYFLLLSLWFRLLAVVLLLASLSLQLDYRNLLIPIKTDYKNINVELNHNCFVKSTKSLSLYKLQILSGAVSP